MNRNRWRIGARRFFAARAVAPAHRLEIAFVAFQRRDFGLGQHFDVRLRLDALDKVVRHGRVETSAARQQPHLLARGAAR